MPFPILAVEGFDGELLNRLRIEAADIHAVTIWVRARHVERLDAANLAEQMLGDAGIESVSG